MFYRVHRSRIDLDKNVAEFLVVPQLLEFVVTELVTIVFVQRCSAECTANEALRLRLTAEQSAADPPVDVRAEPAQYAAPFDAQGAHPWRFEARTLHIRWVYVAE